MALLVDSKNIPKVGEKVRKVVVSEVDGDKAAWITFQSGKTVIAHICQDKIGGGSSVG